MIHRSFGQSLNQLDGMFHLSKVMCRFADAVAASQLQYYVIRISSRKSRQAISEIFCLDLKLIYDFF